MSLKLPSSEVVLKPQLVLTIIGFGFMLALKFLELAFGFEWVYTQRMPLKLVFIYLLAIPRMPESVLKLTEAPVQNVRREGILTVSRGVCELILFRILLYFIPLQWLSLPSSSFSPLFRYLRYGLLGILLYLSLDFVSNIAFGMNSFLFNIPMNSMFPKLPLASTSLRDFWSNRWNNAVKSSLHRVSFKAIPKIFRPIITINKTASGLMAFALSSLLHEYVLWVVTKEWRGKNMTFFLLHGLLVLLEVTVKLPAKPNTTRGKLLGWMWTMFAIMITTPLFFDPWIEIGHYADMK